MGRSFVFSSCLPRVKIHIKYQSFCMLAKSISTAGCIASLIEWLTHRSVVQIGAVLFREASKGAYLKGLACDCICSTYWCSRSRLSACSICTCHTHVVKIAYKPCYLNLTIRDIGKINDYNNGCLAQYSHYQ